MAEGVRRVFRAFDDVGALPVGPAASYFLDDREGRFALRDADGTLILESTHLDVVQHRLKSDVTLAHIRAHPAYLWIHAAGASVEGKAVLLAGPSGRGKSTLVTELCFLGWKYLGDDMLPLDPDSGLVHPYPATAMRREPHRHGHLLRDEEIHQLSRSWIDLSPSSLTAAPSAIRAIILPKFTPEGSHDLRRSTGSEAAFELLKGCINFVEHRENAIRHLCRIIETVPVYHLPWSNASTAANTILESDA